MNCISIMCAATWSSLTGWWILTHCLLCCSVAQPEFVVLSLTVLVFFAMVVARGNASWFSVAVLTVFVIGTGQVISLLGSKWLLAATVSALVAWILRRIAVYRGWYRVELWPVAGVLFGTISGAGFAPATGVEDSYTTQLREFWAFEEVGVCLLFVSMFGAVFETIHRKQQRGLANGKMTATIDIPKDLKL